MAQHPVFPFIVGLFILVMVINDSLLNEKLQKKRFTFAFLNVAFLLVLVFIYEDYLINTLLEPYYFLYALFIYLVFLLIAYTTFRTSILKANHYQLFIRSIKNTRWNAYYVVDEKDRLKDISTSFLEELGVEKEEILGKKIFEVFDRTIRFTKLDDTEINNRSLLTFYKDYKETVKPGQQDQREIHFQNHEGKTIIIHFIEQPVYIFGRYKGRINVGEKKSDVGLMRVEKELIQKNTELESIHHKFIATLEMTEEGLFYIDLDEKYVWGTDAFVKLLKLKANTINLEDYMHYLHKEDQPKYLNARSQLTKAHPKYGLSYRFKQGDNYIWIKESGKRIFEDKNANVILGFVKQMNHDHYERSNIPELDLIKGEEDLNVSLKRLFQTHRHFQLAILKVDNLPDMNEKYGRAVGNMMLGEYIRKLQKTFMTENSELFRISGLEFALTITDVRKMEVLRKALQSDESLMNLKMTYGAIEDELKVVMGIAVGLQDAKDEKGLIQCAKKALKIASNEDFQKNSCYYGDLH